MVNEFGFYKEKPNGLDNWHRICKKFIALYLIYKGTNHNIGKYTLTLIFQMWRNFKKSWLK